MKKIWFKRKRYGWGWYPSTWQGWISTLALVSILLINGFYFASKVENAEPTIIDLVIFFGTAIISVTALIYICYKKGEKPKWSWGN